jgi:hypothetical protein
MHTISDEQLSAFIDKALSDSEMHHINNLLAESAELRERLHRLQQADEMARQFFASQDEIPLPAGLLEQIQAHRPEAEVVQFQPRVRWPWAIAASVVLSVGLVWQILSPAAYTATDRALLSMSSGSVKIMNAEERLEITRSELNSAGQFCRYFIVHTPASSEESSACWQGEQWLYQPPGSSSLYQPAGASEQPAQSLSADEEERWLRNLSQQTQAD